MSLKTQIEALLFAADQPLPLGRLQEVLPDAERGAIAAALDELSQEYESTGRAFRVQRVAGGVQLATRPEFADVVRRLFVGKRRVRLTRPALEALAIIAYKQPTTRPEIDAIRGVSSGGVVETLLERNLVRIAGRADSVGRPLLYATTPEFLQYLGLDSLADLPSLEELEVMLAAREEAARLQEEQEMQELAQTPPPESIPTAGRFAAAHIDDKLRAQSLPTLDELDAELRNRDAAIDMLTAQVTLERRERRPRPAVEPEDTALVDGPDAADTRTADTADAAETQPEAG